jgi:hypothetical protein
MVSCPNHHVYVYSANILISMLIINFIGVENAGNDRIILLRKYLPMMYDKHSVER